MKYTVDTLLTGGDAPLSDVLATTPARDIRSLVQDLRTLAIRLETGMRARAGTASASNTQSDDLDEDYFDNMPV